MLMQQVGLHLKVFVISPAACGKGDCFITNVLLKAARLRGEGKALCRSTVRSLGEPRSQWACLLGSSACLQACLTPGDTRCAALVLSTE